MTPYPDEAGRAVAEALRWNCEHPRCDDSHDGSAHVALTAAMPVLAEHFAQAVEALPYEVFDTETPEWVDREDVLRVIREAANPTEGDQAPADECASCGEGIPEQECPKSKRPCGHHCNHTWTHDSCDWCGFTYEGDQA